MGPLDRRGEAARQRYGRALRTMFSSNLVWVEPWYIYVGNSTIEMSLDLPRHLPRHLLTAPWVSYPTTRTAAALSTPEGRADDIARRESWCRLAWSSDALLDALRSLRTIRSRICWYADSEGSDDVEEWAQVRGATGCGVSGLVAATRRGRASRGRRRDRPPPRAGGYRPLRARPGGRRHRGT